MVGLTRLLQVFSASTAIADERTNEKHVSFAKHLCNNWGLPRGKYLWIHYDEKWFYVWVSQAMAKKCKQLGIE
jgi:hypothetical protein